MEAADSLQNSPVGELLGGLPPVGLELLSAMDRARVVREYLLATYPVYELVRSVGRSSARLKDFYHWNPRPTESLPKTVSEDTEVWIIRDWNIGDWKFMFFWTSYGLLIWRCRKRASAQSVIVQVWLDATEGLAALAECLRDEAGAHFARRIITELPQDLERWLSDMDEAAAGLRRALGGLRLVQRIVQ